MSLLNTVNLPNSLAAHGRHTLAVYSAGVVTVYAKDDKNNTLIPGQTYDVAGVLKIACSENGKVVVVQTATNTIRLQDGTQTVFDMVGEFDCANSGYFVAVNPSINTIHSVKDVTRNINATVSAADRVACGKNKFVVYSSLRSLTGFYSSGVPQLVTPAIPIKFVIHVKDDNFATFYADGTVTYKGNNNFVGYLVNQRNAGKHIISRDQENEYYATRDYPNSKAKPFRSWSTGPIVAQKVKTGTYASTSLSFSAQHRWESDERFFVPKDTTKFTMIQPDLSTVDSGVVTMPYPVMHALPKPFATIKAIGSPAYMSQNDGVSFSQIVGGSGYSGGNAIVFKGSIWVHFDTVWRKYTMDMSSYTTVAGSGFPGNYWAMNKNVIIRSVSTSGATYLQFAWNDPVTVVQLGTEFGTNMIMDYVGMNVFYVRSGGIFKLIWVSPTQAGGYRLLATLPREYKGFLAMKNQLLSWEGTSLSMSGYDMREDEHNATFAEAQAMVNQLLNQTAGKNVHVTLNQFVGQDYMVPWRAQNRVVLGTRVAYEVWQLP